MKVRELRERLKAFDADLPVEMVTDCGHGKYSLETVKLEFDGTHVFVILSED